MTHEEAVKILKANNERRIALTYLMIKNMAINALEKQIPKKPTKRSELATFYECPDCGHLVTNVMSYCPHCGQDLEWGNNEV